MNLGAFLLALLMAVFIGTRPNSYVFVDHMNYYYSSMSNLGNTFSFDWNTDNILFDNFWMFLASNRTPIVYFYLTCAMVYFFAMYGACKRLFPNDTLLAFVVCLGAFSTFAAGTNGFKNGAACSVFLLAMAYRDRLPISLLLMAVSYGIHHSMQLLLASFAVTFFVKDIKKYFYLWLFCFVMAALHVTAFQDFFGSITDEQGAGYLDTRNDLLFVTGFRLDFIIYSSAPVIIGFWMIFKEKLQSEKYNFLLKIYLMANSIWMLCMYASFTNRIAYLSWSILPIVMVYPFTVMQNSKKALRLLRYVVYGHLAFTLFMQLVYYA